MKKNLKSILLMLTFTAGAFYAGWQGPALLSAWQTQPEARETEPVFYPLERFVISVPGDKQQHYVLLELALKTRTVDAQLHLQRADPLVRNALMKMFAAKKVQELNQAGNLELLQNEAQVLLSQVLKDNQFAVQLDDVLFTRLVIQ